MNQFTLISLKKFQCAENRPMPVSPFNKDPLIDSLENIKRLFHVEECSNSKSLSLRFEPLAFIQKLSGKESKSSEGYKTPFIAQAGVLFASEDVKAIEDFFLALSNPNTTFKDAFIQLIDKTDGDHHKALFYTSYILSFVGRHTPSDFEEIKNNLILTLRELPCFAKMIENKETQTVYNVLFNPIIPFNILQNLILIHSYLQTCRTAFLTFEPSVELQGLPHSPCNEVVVKFNKSKQVMTVEGNFFRALKSLEKYLMELPSSIPFALGDQIDKVSDFFFPPISSYKILPPKKYSNHTQEIAEEILPYGDFFLSHKSTQTLGFLLICRCGEVSDSKKLLTKILKLLPELLTSTFSADTKKTLLIAFSNYYYSVLPGQSSKTENELLAVLQCVESCNEEFKIVDKLCDYFAAFDEKFAFEEVFALFNKMVKSPENHCTLTLNLGVRLIKKCTSLGWKPIAYKIFSSMPRSLPLFLTLDLPPKIKVDFLKTFYQQLITLCPHDPLKDENKSFEELCKLFLVNQDVQDLLVGLCKFFTLSSQKWVVINIFPLYDKLRDPKLSKHTLKANWDEMSALGIRLINRCIFFKDAKAAAEIFKVLRSNPKITSNHAISLFNKIVEVCLSSESKSQSISMCKETALQLYVDCDYLFTHAQSTETSPNFIPIFQLLLAHNEPEKASKLLATAIAKKAPETLGGGAEQLCLSLADKFYKEGKFSQALILWKKGGPHTKEGMDLFFEWALLLFKNTLSKEEVLDLIKTLLNASKPEYVKTVIDFVSKERLDRRVNLFEAVELLQPAGLWLYKKRPPEFLDLGDRPRFGMALKILQQAGILTFSHNNIPRIAVEGEMPNWIGAFLFCISNTEPGVEQLSAEEIVEALKGMASNLLDSQDIDEKSFGLSLLCTLSEIQRGKDDLALAFAALPSILSNDCKRRAQVWDRFLMAFDFSIFDLDRDRILKFSEMLNAKNSSSGQILESFCKLFSSIECSSITETTNRVWSELGSPIGLSIEMALLSLVNHFEMAKKMLARITCQKRVVMELSQEGAREAFSQIKNTFPNEIKEKELRILYELFVHSIQNKRQLTSGLPAEETAWLISQLFKYTLRNQKPLFTEGLFLLGLAEKNKIFSNYPEIALELKYKICMENYPEENIKSIYPLYEQLLDGCHADFIAEKIVGCRKNYPSVSPELFRLTLHACQKAISSENFKLLQECLIDDLKKGRNDSTSFLEIYMYLEEILIRYKELNAYTLFFSFFEQLSLKSICLLPTIEKQNLYPLIRSYLEENPFDSNVEVLTSALKLFTHANSLGSEGMEFYFETAERYSSIPCLEVALNSKMESLIEEEHFTAISKLVLTLIEREVGPEKTLLLMQKIQEHFKDRYPAKLVSLWITFLSKQTEKALHAFVATVLIENAPWFNEQDNIEQVNALASINAKGLLQTQIGTSVVLSDLYMLNPEFWAYFFLIRHLDKAVFVPGFKAFIRNRDNYSCYGGASLAHAWVLALRNCPPELQGTFPIVIIAYKEIVECVQMLNNEECTVDVRRLLLAHLFKRDRNSSCEKELNYRLTGIRKLCAHESLQKDRLFQMQCIGYLIDMEHPKALEVACKEIEGFYLSLRVASPILTNSIDRALLQCSKLSCDDHPQIFQLLAGIMKNHARLFPSSRKHKSKDALDLCCVMKFQQNRLKNSKINLGDFIAFARRILDQFEEGVESFNEIERMHIKCAFNAIFELTPTEFTLSACRNLFAHPSYAKLWNSSELAYHSSKMIVNSFKLYDADAEHKGLQRLVRVFLSCRKFIKALGALEAKNSEVLETLIDHMFSLMTEYGSWENYIQVYYIVIGYIGNAAGLKIKMKWQETMTVTVPSMRQTLTDFLSGSVVTDEIERVHSQVDDFKIDFDPAENKFANDKLYLNFAELFIQKCIPNENTSPNVYMFFIANCYFFLSQNVDIIDRGLMISFLYKFMIHVYPTGDYVNFRNARMIDTMKCFLLLDVDDVKNAHYDAICKLELLSAAVHGNPFQISDIVLKDKHYLQIVDDLCRTGAAVNLHPMNCLLAYVLTFSNFEVFTEIFSTTLREYPKHSKFVVNEKIVLKVKCKDHEKDVDDDPALETLWECTGKILILKLLDKKIKFSMTEKLVQLIQEYLKVCIAIILKESPLVVELNTPAKWKKTFLFFIKFLKATAIDPRLQNYRENFLEMARTLIPLSAKVEKRVAADLLTLINGVYFAVDQKSSPALEILYAKCINEFEASISSINK